MDQEIRERIKQLKMELLAMLSEPKEYRTKQWEKCVREAKKGIERAMYEHVVQNGCTDDYSPGRYPELVLEYDPESYEMLDEKIHILGEIAKKPDCDYQNIEGFEKILELKPPKGQKVEGFID